MEIKAERIRRGANTYLTYACDQSTGEQMKIGEFRVQGTVQPQWVEGQPRLDETWSLAKTKDNTASLET